MKPVTSPWLTAVLCGTAALSQSAFAQVDACVGPLSRLIPASSPVASLAPSANYDDILARCQTWVTDLQNARWSADLEARSGNIDGAAQLLFRALLQKRNEIGGRYNPAPNTADAIRASINIADEVFDASNATDVPLRLRDELRYLMLDSLYGFIEQAYFNIDQEYYHHVSRYCSRYRQCQNGDFSEFPPAYSAGYYDGVRQLALGLLDLQIRLDELQASDVLELRVSRAVTSGASDMLLSSVLRRNLSCPINKLVFATKQIDRFLSCGDIALPRYEQVHLVRELILDARHNLSDSGCDDSSYRR
ncbi:MAG: hypothetical protein NDJ90_04255 [Oligoflexia bacterium]|nr:hypothetical protein [Oligoflexia bacterium]